MQCPSYDIIERITRAAKCGNARAQYHLGWCYLFGRKDHDDFARPNIKKALIWLNKSAKHGNAEAQLLLAKLKEQEMPVT